MSKSCTILECSVPENSKDQENQKNKKRQNLFVSLVTFPAQMFNGFYDNIPVNPCCKLINPPEINPNPPPSSTLPPTIASYSANWAIQSNTVPDANYCYIGPSSKDSAPLTLVNYSSINGLNIQEDGTILPNAGTYNISFACQGNYGPVLGYLFAVQSGKTTQTNNGSSYVSHKSECNVSGVYWTRIWYGVSFKAGDKVNFYVADMYQNSGTYPTFQGSITFAQTS